MLQIQQELNEEIQSQLDSNPPSPEDRSTWAEHPVTIYFLNQFRLKALEKEAETCVHLDGHMLERQLCLDVGYAKAVQDMEETIEGFRKMTEGDDDEPEKRIKEWG